MPDWSREIRERLSGLKVDPAREQSIVDEISQHLDDRYAELLAERLFVDGCVAAEAAQQPHALQRRHHFGGIPIRHGREPAR